MYFYYVRRFQYLRKFYVYIKQDIENFPDGMEIDVDEVVLLIKDNDVYHLYFD